MNQLIVSLDELVSGFRFQQLQLSTTMMNASYHARLPEKLAAAEAREADQREAKGIKLQEHVYKNVFKTISNGIKPTRIHLNFSIFISLLQYGQDQKRKKTCTCIIALNCHIMFCRV